MIFEAERGSGWAADIALDEIRFQPGDCGGHVVVTTTLPPPTTQPTTPAATRSKFFNYTNSMSCCTNEIALRLTSYQQRYWRPEKDADKEVWNPRRRIYEKEEEIGKGWAPLSYPNPPIPDLKFLLLW